MLPLTDRAIRVVLKNELLQRQLPNSDTLIVEELGLKHGSARIDIAVINQTLDGFEIKSDCDSLDRLPHQMQVFSAVFDSVTLVVGRRLADLATTVVPDWWGIKLAEADSSSVPRLCDIRRPSFNPSPDLLSITRLLWRSEALGLLQQLGSSDGMRSKPRAAIYQLLVDSADPLWLRATVRRQLRSRTGWRSESPRT